MGNKAINITSELEDLIKERYNDGLKDIFISYFTNGGGIEVIFGSAIPEALKDHLEYMIDDFLTENDLIYASRIFLSENNNHLNFDIESSVNIIELDLIKQSIIKSILKFWPNDISNDVISLKIRKMQKDSEKRVVKYKINNYENYELNFIYHLDLFLRDLDEFITEIQPDNNSITLDLRKKENKLLDINITWCNSLTISK